MDTFVYVWIPLYMYCVLVGLLNDNKKSKIIKREKVSERVNE